MIGFLAQRRRTSTVAMVRVSTVAMVRVFDPQPPVAMVRVFGRAYPRLLWCVFFGFLKTLFSSDSGESLILLVTRRVYGAASSCSLTPIKIGFWFFKRSDTTA